MTQSLSADDVGLGRTIALLVIEEFSSRRFPLPSDGLVTVGRSTEADVRIDSTAVSRLHARFIVAAGEVQVADLDSRNGTLVNGERIRGSRTLSPGDVVTIGEASLLLSGGLSGNRRQLADMTHMRTRLEDELARASEYSGVFAVVVLHLDNVGHRASAAPAAFAALRRMDLLAVDGSSFVALLPELDGEAARSVAAVLLATVAPWVPSARAGVASYPGDGGDAETLLAGARGAAAIARPGGISAASEATMQHAIGERRIVVADAVMVRLYDLIRRLAASELSVLILGETGTGKENAAAALHEWSPRASQPFVALNCAALPETLIESELFGYERGAFSDARQAKPGLLERAHGGTVFLDEVGELAPSAQGKLLRALEQRRIMRLGDVREREVDIRIVAATNRNLEAAVQANRFRADLLFRLGAAFVELPPLRHRRREVPLLARLFLEEECARRKRPALRLSSSTLARLAEYEFPGNVRELKNAMEYAVATTEDSVIQPWNLPPRMAGPVYELAPERGAEAGAGETAPAAARFRPIAEELRELEKVRMLEALDASHGVQKHAAAAICMPIRTFTLKLKQYGIAWRDPKNRHEP